MPRERQVWVDGVEGVADGAELIDMDKESIEEEAANEEVVEEEETVTLGVSQY